MKKLIALILAVVILLVPTVALASDITRARWYSIITISNNSTATDDVFTTFPLGTQNLIDTNFLSANLTDCTMHDTSGIDTAFMPSVNATYPWCLYVSNIGEDAFRNYLLYTGGNADMDGKIRYFPAAGGMTSADNATLELSDNFTIEQKGWWDTDNGTDKNTVYKHGATSLFESPTISENITFAVLGWGANQTETLRPDGHDTCVIPQENGAACNDHYLNVDEVAADDATTAVHTGGSDATIYTDYYTLEDTTIPTTANISEVTVYIRGNLITVAKTFFRGDLKLNGNTTTGTPHADVAWTTHNEALARPGGGNWQQSDLDDLLIGVTVQGGAGVPDIAWVTQTYIVVTWQPSTETVSVSATGVESGEHTVKATTNDPGLSFDGVNDGVVCGNDPSLDNVVEGSILVWFNPARDNNLESLVSRTEGIGWQDFGVWLHLNTGADIEWTMSNDIVADQENFIAATVKDVWQQVVLTWTGSGAVVKGYYNGNDVYTGASTVVPAMAGKDLEFGLARHATYDYEGLISEVRIYDRALTSSEIQAYYDGNPISDTGLIGLWLLNEGTGGSTEDTSANTNNGTITGATWITSPLLRLYIDDEHTSTTVGATVPNTDNDWAFLQNYSMPYMEYHKIWIDGVLQQHIEYEYNDTVFSDLSGQLHPAYPTFRTASSDADVAATMASFLPIEEAKAPAWVLETEREFWDTENITAAGTFTTTPTPTAAPGIAVIEAIAAASGTPSQLPFTIISGFVILAASLTFTWFMAKHGSRNLWVKSALIAILMAFCVSVKVYDFWMVLFFIFMAIAVTLFSRQRSVG